MRYWFVQNESATWLVIAENKDQAIDKFLVFTGFSKSDFSDGEFTINEENPII